MATPIPKTAQERNKLLATPSTDAKEIISFFQEMQRLMTGVDDVLNTTPRKWQVILYKPSLIGKIEEQQADLETLKTLIPAGNKAPGTTT